MRTKTAKLITLVATGLLAATSGQAFAQTSGTQTYTLGSDLSQPANATVQQPVDTVLWNLILGHLQSNFPGVVPTGPASGAMPADGQIVAVRVKGTALPTTAPGAPPPLTQIHFQDLQPQPDGTTKVIASSQPLNLPSSGDPNQVSTYAPTNLCVHKGDFLGFNDEGGFDPNFYPQGVPFQVLSNVTGSTTDRFSGHNQTGNGAIFTGIPMKNELLMQWDLATGADATPLCGGTHNTIFGSLDPPTFATNVDVEVISGTVSYLPPATTAQASKAKKKKKRKPITKGRPFIPLTAARQIPIGSLLDTTHGTVRLVSANAAGITQSGDFGAGIFQILQNRAELGLAQLTLSGGLHQANVCRRPARKASAARLSSKVLRLLRSNVKGSFRSRGNFAAATVRGTQWLMEDRCDGTFTRVQRGSVVVRDFRRHKDITLNAGQSVLVRR